MIEKFFELLSLILTKFPTLFGGFFTLMNGIHSIIILNLLPFDIHYIDYIYRIIKSIKRNVLMIYVVFFIFLASFLYLIKKLGNQIEYNNMFSSIFTGISKYIIIFSSILFIGVMLFEIITDFMKIEFNNKNFLIIKIMICGFLYLLFYSINTIIDKDFNEFIKKNTIPENVLQNKINEANPLISLFFMLYTFIKLHGSYFLYKINPYYQVPIIYNKLFKKKAKPDEKLKTQEYILSFSKFLTISITLLYAIILDILYENFGIREKRNELAAKWKNKMKNKLDKKSFKNEIDNLLHKIFFTI
jgi:hypothetical protein